jgi:3',5'-cyclic AMP phosphodiesterase CpdA
VTRFKIDLSDNGRGSLDMLLHAGDISYADGLGERWDSYGRMAEFLTEALPAVVTGGNHEFAGTEEWIHFSSRYACRQWAVNF